MEQCLYGEHGSMFPSFGLRIAHRKCSQCPRILSRALQRRQRFLLGPLAVDVYPTSITHHGQREGASVSQPADGSQSPWGRVGQAWGMGEHPGRPVHCVHWSSALPSAETPTAREVPPRDERRWELFWEPSRPAPGHCPSSQLI